MYYNDIVIFYFFSSNRCPMIHLIRNLNSSKRSSEKVADSS